ncbi:MAG: biotin/lipoate A/B protein ligase family protein [Planctomycetaceae bacterium]
MPSLGSLLTPSPRLLVDQKPASGGWNMAVDAVLLETALSTGRATLRWYRWEEPTLSLGHFQAADDQAIGERFAGVPKVRRLSGGGAILHDQEWTYSLAVGPDRPCAAHPLRLYRLIHDAVIDVLEGFEIPARQRGTADATRDGSFLCFSRGDANDVVVGSHKVLGSAQRRRRGAILQHGALLLRASALAPEFPGLLDLASHEVEDARLFAELTRVTAETLGFPFQSTDLDPQELQRVSNLVSQHTV